MTIRMGKRRLMAYRRKCQKFPLQLPPQELRDDLTKAFEGLKATCKEPMTVKHHWCDWMSDSMWLLIKQRTLLCWAGQLCKCKGQRMQCAIHAALKKDPAALTAQVGKSIIATCQGKRSQGVLPSERMVFVSNRNAGATLFTHHGKADAGACQSLPAAGLTWSPPHR